MGYKIEQRVICVERNGYNPSTKRKLCQENKKIIEQYPFIVVDKKDCSMKLILDKVRGSYLYTDKDKMFGILTHQELQKYYLKYTGVDSKVQEFLDDFKEKVDNYCDTEL